MILPTATSLDDNYIFVSTGTGIAPFRALARYLCVETVSESTGKGSILHFAGVRNSASLLYRDDLQASAQHARKYFETVENSKGTSIDNLVDVNYILSREDQAEHDNPQSLPASKQQYVQDALKHNMADVMDRMINRGAFIYFCGLKAMMDGVMEVFQSYCEREGLNWESILENWKEEGRWRVGVYTY
jgi:benzoyl-CoA 2,3-dioxygenase component A